jgi:hypothetical protein
VVLLNAAATEATRAAELSKPFGKITLAASLFTCCHFTEGGLPPKRCACKPLTITRQKAEQITDFIKCEKYFQVTP